MAKVAATYKFSRQETPDGVAFAVKGEPLGFLFLFGLAVLALVLGGFAALIFGLTANSGTVGWMAFFAVLVISFVLFVQRNIRRTSEVNLRVTRASLAVSTKGSESEYEIGHIGSIFVRNKAANAMETAIVQPSGSGFIVGGTGITGVATAGFAAMSNAANRMGAATGQAAGAAMRHDMAKRGWSVGIRYGTKSIDLVRFLQHETAEALYEELCASIRSK